MSEYDMRGKVVRALKDYHAIPVENSVCAGTPDVNCTLGWIELKWLRNWPSNEETCPLGNGKIRREQINWANRRQKAYGGASVYLLLQVKREWFLFSGFQMERLEVATRQGLYDLALIKSSKGLDATFIRDLIDNLIPF